MRKVGQEAAQYLETRTYRIATAWEIGKVAVQNQRMGQVAARMYLQTRVDLFTGTTMIRSGRARSGTGLCEENRGAIYVVV